MPNSVMPDSVMLNSYLMLYHIPLYHFPLYLIPDCPLECYNRFLFSVIPDSIISDSVIPDSCFDIPDSVMPNSVIPDSSFACYNRFRYTRFPAPRIITPQFSLTLLPLCLTISAREHSIVPRLSCPLVSSVTSLLSQS